MGARNNSIASQSANIQRRANQVAGQVAAEQGWQESKLKPKKITARYPIKGKALLSATCGYGSLSDALFGYNSGIMSGLLVNPVFVKRFFSDFGGADGNTAAVNPSITGISVVSAI